MAVSKTTEKLKSFFKRLKAVKNIEIIIAIVVIALIILVYSVASNNKNNSGPSDSGQTVSASAQDMTSQLQSELSTILSKIDGAGNVEVLITFAGSTEKMIANTKSTHTNSTNSSGEVVSSTTTVTETPILINANGSSQLYILEEKLPKVVGVIVVAEGAKNAKVRLELMRAVQTTLNVNASSIEIFAMK